MQIFNFNVSDYLNNSLRHTGFEEKYLGELIFSWGLKIGAAGVHSMRERERC